MIRYVSFASAMSPSVGNDLLDLERGRHPEGLGALPT